MQNQVLAWTKKATEDLEAAKALKSLKFYDTSCYHMQQASEKILKALVVKLLQQEPPRTHDLSRLCALLNTSNLVVLNESVISACDLLTGYATLMRYPGYDATEEDCIEGLEHVSVVFNEVMKILSNPSELQS